MPSPKSHPPPGGLTLRPFARGTLRIAEPVLRGLVAAESLVTHDTRRGTWAKTLYRDENRVDMFEVTPEGRFENVQLLPEMAKIRSMRVDNGPYSSLGNQSPGVTRVGNALRKTGLDELPQLGTLAVVGRRPPLTADLVRVESLFGDVLPIELGMAWGASSQMVPSGLIDANGPVRKSDASSITDWPDRILHDVVFAAAIQSGTVELPGAVAVTAVHRMLGGGMVGKVAARAASTVLGCNLTVREAEELYVDHIERATVDDAVQAAYDSGLLKR